jgi:hypothetical protein
MSSYSQAPQRPVHIVRAGGIRIPIWEQEREKDGRRFTVFSAQIQNQYYDEDVKKFMDSKSYMASDLADLELAVHEARAFMRLKVEESRQTNEAAADAEASQA